MDKKTHRNGFTIIEILISIAILLIITAISVASFNLMQKNVRFNSTSEEIVSALKAAQNSSMASENFSSHGVYFDELSEPHQYVLFQGSSYETRDNTFDKIVKLHNSMEFYDINLSNESKEVVFDRLTGTTANAGSLSVRFINDTDKNNTIYIDNAGTISYNPSQIPEDTRFIDSRHITFEYSRTIDSQENIILTFDPGESNTQVVIPVSDNIVNDQFFWEETTDISGSDQTIKIHTLRLNSPDTLFSVFRDRRHNDKKLIIELSGDITGKLIDYSDDGSIITFDSIYVENLTWQ